MKVFELRIGNYLQRGNEIVEVDAIFRSHFNCRRESDKIHLGNNIQNNFQPIQITEEILLKCGFECVNKKNIHYAINDPKGFKDSHKISIFPTLNEQWHIAFSDILNGYKDYIPTTKLKYLHQLQNFYFALANEELQIQL